MKKMGLIAATAAMTVGLSVNASAADTLASVKERGFVQCGVTTGVPGYSNPDDKGNWKGMDVDVCRGIAAATLGDADKVKYIPLNAKERFTALQSGEIDVLSRVTTWTLTRDSSLGLNFAGVTYYDGQGFLINKGLGVKSALELNGASICIQSGTTTELNAADYFRENNMQFEPVVFDTADQTVKGFEAGRCDVLTSDQSQLYALRIKLSNPDAAIILPEIISKEPLGPVVSQGDDAWFNVVKWSLFAMINAEELGLTSKNIDSKKNSSNPNIARFVGAEGIKGTGLSLSDNWAYNIVKQVGNYGEAFDRNLGAGSALKIERGLNALWNKGGLQYAPPIR